MTITIDRIETAILDVPTIRGHVLSMATMTTQSVVLVTIRFSDGSVGLGEGTTIGGMSYGPESPESIRLAVDSYIAPLLLGRDADAVLAAAALVERQVKGNPIARSAVEIALWDGFARRLGLPLASVFGGAVRGAMPVAWTLASGEAASDIEEAEDMLARHRHRIFKLKIGKREVREDIAHVARIAAAVGDRASIRVDVNQAWSLAEARWGLRGLQEVGVDLVEQPVARDDLSGLKALTDAGEIAVMADEALSGPASALRIAANRGADVFAVKVAQSGGLSRAREVTSIAASAGIGVYGGTMLESGVATAASLHLFATAETLEWGTEFFGPLLFAHEILAKPLVYRDFAVELPAGPGIGVQPDPDPCAFFDREKRRTVHPVSRAV
ncbi:muconate/chloromuconate family cycloisomerase [Aureimonas populi]|uniref:Muconate/chloromuconate family cycloisomerase n=1 Tax=Aureimonas populi TaxID=1701758 RepID=A0ABW5CPG9_9HYPH|nr:muconate/chloromuconate family cycloisomerase [Aureimonas populi]